MRVTIVHQLVPPDAPADERDVLDQVAAVRAALESLGHAVAVLPCTTDLGNLWRKLTLQVPDAVFNLVESLDGSGRLLHLAPALWETHGLPFTGCSADALYLTTHKLLAKERMAAAGLPTPAWVADGSAHGDDGARGDWIVKSVWEHASIGLDDGSIARSKTAAEVAATLRSGWFAERFVDGREFNLSVLAGPRGPEVLPPAEIVFVDYPADKPKIVGYDAKWSEGSFEHGHTVRRFADRGADGALLARLEQLALRCWQAFGLAGCARVDFRVDERGEPWILEVNANPCLSPDGGFAAACQQAGIPYAGAVARILADAPTNGLDAAPAAPAAPARRAGAAPDVAFRYAVGPGDVEAVREVTASTGYFHDDEVGVAVELVEERLAKGAASGYEFVFAEYDGRVVGYASFGPVPCTRSSFDWYWLAVRPEFQRFGIGRRLLAETERLARAMGGTRLYCETSSRPQYASTRAFYERMGFQLCEVLEDFYDVGDGRATYVKRL